LRPFARRLFSTSIESSLVTQYRYVPVGEHPIFPGSTTSLSLTQEEFDMVKDTETVFASIIKNDSILTTESDIMAQM
jgi:hypothetical protein